MTKVLPGGTVLLRGSSVLSKFYLFIMNALLWNFILFNPCFLEFNVYCTLILPFITFESLSMGFYVAKYTNLLNT